MSRKTVYGISPQQLARLLAIGLQGGKSQETRCASETPADMFQVIWSRQLPLDPAIPDSFPAVLNRPCDELIPATGCAMRQLLLDSKTDLAVVKTVKEYGKRLVRRGGPETKRAAAIAIYYAAIASALVFHEHKITRHSFRRLDRAYAELEEKLWIASELKALFQKARAFCQGREKKAV